jgi:hypothetical protein
MPCPRYDELRQEGEVEDCDLRVNLRSVPLPSDPLEGELLEQVRELGGLHVKFSGMDRRAGRPHVHIYGPKHDEPPIAVFRNSAEALRWLEEERAWAGKEAQA